jgi:hypothetical protein
MHEYKWNFKEGDVAILSFPRPGSGRSTEFFLYASFFLRKSPEYYVYLPIPLLFLAAQSGRSSRRAVGSNEDAESECGRLVGTVRRHMPIDTRDPIGAIIHFYVGDSFDSNRYHFFWNVIALVSVILFKLHFHNHIYYVLYIPKASKPAFVLILFLFGRTSQLVWFSVISHVCVAEVVL